MMRIYCLVLLVGVAMGQELPGVYGKYCAACHGEGARGTDRGPGLVDTRSLREADEARVRRIIEKGTGGGMPAFGSLGERDLGVLVKLVRGWNASAFEARPEGDVAAGERVFGAQCQGCHRVAGDGASRGPDLSAVGRSLTVAEMEQVLLDPNSRRGKKSGAGCPSWAFCPEDPWAVVRVTLKDGRVLRGFARSGGAHDLQVQDLAGKLHLLREGDYTSVEKEKQSLMPAMRGTSAERRDLIAYLSRLGGVGVGPRTKGGAASAGEVARVDKPVAGDWPGYHGLPSGNRHSGLAQITTANAKDLVPGWTYTLPHNSLQTTPLAVEGVLYVTAPNRVCALAGDTGREIWCYGRQRSDATVISGDAALGAQRGVAMLGDQIFFSTDDAHLIALDRLTGALRWQVFLPQGADGKKLPGAYGATAAPLVIGGVAGGLVVAGVAGGDAPLRGFLAAFEPATGKEVWRFWTIPARGEPGSETWKGKALEMGGGATWLTGSYDPGSGVLYWPVGNPYPDTDGSEREGDNLYTDSVVALDGKTGKLRWHFQFTPHDLWDWDATEPLVLADAVFRGRERKLLMQANRNGFFYVLDRTTGEYLLGSPFVKQLTWASGLDAKGRPQVKESAKPTMGGTLTCPAVRGATNWYATAFSPATRLFYVMAVEDCNLYRKAGDWFVPYSDPANPPQKYLRAIDIETGKIAWEVKQVGAPEANYSGVLSTAGGLLFYGESGGSFAAADARSGKTLWHFNTGQVWKASPMTYLVNGKQYVAVAAGGSIVAFRLRE
jgi:PQQ-dependent dehydrogenase (methanol/ethanol family)